VARQLAHIAPEDTLEILELPPPPKLFEAFAEAFGGTRLTELALPELELALATPELREVLMQTVHLLATARETLVALLPVAVYLH